MRRTKSHWILGTITKRGPVRLLVETTSPAALTLNGPGTFNPDYVSAPVLGYLLEAYDQPIKFESVRLAPDSDTNQCVPRLPDYDYTIGEDALRLWVLPNK